MEPYPSGQTDPDGRPDYTEAPRAFTLDRPGATLEAAAGVTWRISVYPRADGSDRYPLVSNLAAGQNLTLTGEGTGQIDKVIPGAGGLVKTGSGTWILTGANTYTGTTTISGGALEIRHANALGATGTDQGTTVSSGATLRLAVPEGTTGITFAEPLSLAGSGVSSVGALQNAAGTNTWTGAVTLTANTSIGVAAGSQLTISGGIGQSGGTRSLTKLGSGTLVLAGDNTYTGTTTVSQGVLEIRHANALGATGTNQGTTVSSDATLRLAVPEGTPGITFAAEPLNLAGSGVGGVGALYNYSGNNTWTGPITLTNHTAIGVADGTTLTITGQMSESPNRWSLTKVGAGTLVFAVAQNYASETIVAEGTLKLAALNVLASNVAVKVGSGSSSGILDLAGYDQRLRRLQTSGTGTENRVINSGSTTSTLTFVCPGGEGYTFAGTIEGNIRLVKEEGGMFILTGQNTYTGGTTIKEGVLQLSGGDDRLNPAGNITILGGTLDLGSTTQNITGSAVVSFQGGTVQNGTINNTSSQPYDGQAGYVSAVLAGSAGLVKTGTGTLTLSRVKNTYTGGTTIQEGTLILAGWWGDYDRLNPAGNITILGGTLDLGSTTQNITGSAVVSFQGGTVQNGTINKAGGNYTTDGSSGNATVSAVLAGSAGLVKTGSGTLTLSGANTYTGGTTVTAGKLLVNNTSGSGTGSGAVTVGNQAVLGGTGRIAGDVTIQSGGLLTAGDLDATLGDNSLQIGGHLTMQSDSTWVVDIFGDDYGSATWDLIDLTGAGKTASLTNVYVQVKVHGNFVPTKNGEDHSITILKAANINISSLNFSTPPTGYTAWNVAIVDLGGGWYGLKLWAAPEPSSWLMLLVGGAGLGLLRWYRRRSAGQNR
jgi:autotransporter-associated beta strand protein